MSYNGRTDVNGTGNTSHHTRCPHGTCMEPDKSSSLLAHLFPSEDSHTTILNVRQVLSRDIERRWLEIYAVQRRGRKCYKHLELLSTSPITLAKLFPLWKTFRNVFQSKSPRPLNLGHDLLIKKYFRSVVLYWGQFCTTPIPPPPWEHLAMSGDILGCNSLGVRILLVSSG